MTAIPKLEVNQAEGIYLFLSWATTGVTDTVTKTAEKVADLSKYILGLGYDLFIKDNQITKINTAETTLRNIVPYQPVIRQEIGEPCRGWRPPELSGIDLIKKELKNNSQI